MKTRSRGQGRTAGVGSVKRPSAGFGPIGETRRKQPLSLRRAGMKVRGVLPFPRTRDDRLSALPVRALIVPPG